MSLETRNILPRMDDTIHGVNFIKPVIFQGLTILTDIDADRHHESRASIFITNLVISFIEGSDTSC